MTEMTTFVYVLIYEVEHSGDAENAAADIREAGGKIYEPPVCDFEGSESAMFKVEVEDVPEFWKRFENTDSFDFSNHS